MNSTVWWRKLTDGDEAMFNKNNVPNDAFPICLETPSNIEGVDPFKNFAVFRSAYTLLLECVKTPDIKRCFFEIIRANHSQKHYADIDIKLEDDKLTEQFHHTIEEKIAIANIIVAEYISAILKVNPEIKTTDILVFNSNSSNKRSYHIIVDRWYFPTCKQNKEFFKKCIEYIPLSHRKYIDNRMYKPNQQFRLFLSTKCGKNRTKVLDPQSPWKSSEIIEDPNQMLKEIFYASLITLTDIGCQMIPYEYEDRSEYYATRDLDDKECDAVIKIFRTFEDASSFEIIGIKSGSLLVLRRRRPSYCKVCCRTHDHEHPFVYTTFDNNVYFSCRRCDESQLLGNINNFTEKKENKITTNKEQYGYEIPSLGCAVNTSTFVDNGILNLSNGIPLSEVKSVKQMPHLMILQSSLNNEENSEMRSSSNSPVSIANIERTYVIRENNDSIYKNARDKAKLKYTNKSKESIDVILSRSYNRIAIM